MHASQGSVTGSDVFGREEDIAFLDDAWANQDVNVVTLTSWFVQARSRKAISASRPKRLLPVTGNLATEIFGGTSRAGGRRVPARGCLGERGSNPTDPAPVGGAKLRLLSLWGMRRTVLLYAHDDWKVFPFCDGDVDPDKS
jgi:hypothetical protein